jgi:hypothetical protein
MKRMMIALMSLALAIPALAQYGRPHYYRRHVVTTYHRPVMSLDVYYGLRLGGSFATVRSDDQYLHGGSMKAGLNVGAVAGFQLGYASPVYFETGVYYIEKGGEGRYEGSKFTYGLNYIEVPLLLKYRIDAARGFSIQPFAGGYLSGGVGGNIKDFGHRQAFSSFGRDGFKRFDGGLRLGLGMQFDLLYAEVGYDIGLSNISQDNFDSTRTGSLFATVGVNF